MEPGYVCRTFLRTKSPATLLRNLRYIRDYRASRGMAFWTDVRDRLGGWPHGPETEEEVTGFCGGGWGFRRGRWRRGRRTSNASCPGRARDGE